jgi:hypothetical protein
MFDFSSATVLLSGTQYPTMHLGYRAMRKIEKELASYKASNLANPKNPLAQTIQPMIEKFEKYWLPMKEFLAIGVVINPRYKMRYLRFSLEGSVEASEIDSTISKIQSAILSLWTIYAPATTPVETISQPQATKTIDEEDSRFAQYMNVVNAGVGLQSNAPGDELDLYLEECNISMTNKEDFNILGWWKSNVERFPGLSKLVKVLLMIPMTSVASESAFSTGGRVIDNHCTRLNDENVKALICAQDWLKSGKHKM